MDILPLIILVIGLVLVTISWVKADIKCPAPKVVYKYIPKHQLDVQFGEENNASEIFFDMFTKGSPMQGGYQLGGKSYITLRDGRRQQLVNMFESQYGTAPSRAPARL